MQKHIRIWSYFSIETDLASEMCTWPEFIRGNGYSVDLRDPSSGESITVRYVQNGEDRYVHVTGVGCGSSFEHVTGKVIYAMSAHSDSLTIDRHNNTT